ncbi:hypothetical protein TNCV_3451111 [Trichonephila clavipes]|uniref:Uncharacterized protein n=1 Tax=Trichonephila clavipes TaxID=2585209 RepID=A0A8X7BMC9_TRICX|nr:hypothetical protein TNCV_3451111 [Trichonephila clavipes]
MLSLYILVLPETNPLSDVADPSSPERERERNVTAYIPSWCHWREAVEILHGAQYDPPVHIYLFVWQSLDSDQCNIVEQ